MHYVFREMWNFIAT